MSRPEIDFHRVPEQDIPEDAKLKCRPGDYVWRITAEFDDETLERIEEIAAARTAGRIDVDNDIGRKDICPTKTARLVHAIEHIITLDLLESGQIPPSSLLEGNIALTVPGNTFDGHEIAAFWIRGGLVDDDLVENALREIAENWLE